MAAKTSNKDRILNMVYSLGAAVVILGALCKINHYSPLGIEGSTILAIGLGVEALIFLIFAFDPPAGDYEWEKVYPELEGDASGVAVRGKKSMVAETSEVETSLSAKLDKMLADAKLDTGTMVRLRDGIENFSNSVQDINKVVDTTNATRAYGDQMALAANNMESLNALYQVQLENGKKQAALNQKFVEDMEKSASGSEQFLEEMNRLTNNVQSLNQVYGGMLSAMRNPQV